MYFAAVLLASALSGISSAQTVDPSTVSSGDKQQWCKAQQSSCPLLCLQYPGNNAGTESNSCDPTTLDFSCVCWNGKTPNASQYSQTIPYFECTEYGNQCVAACGQDSTCASNCRKDNPCGAQNPTRVNTSTITTQTKTATGSATGSGGSNTAFATLGGSGSSETGSSSGGGTGSGGVSGNGAGQLAIDLGRTYGLAVVLGGVFAGFMLVL